MLDKKAFLSHFSHEARAHLGLIRNYAEILLAFPPKVQEQRSDFLRIIRDESEYLINLLAEIVTIEKIESGIMQWDMARVSPALALQRSLLECEEEAKRKEITIDFQVDPSLPLVSMDEIMMSRVFTHLLRNAIRFSARGRTVRLQAVHRQAVAGSEISEIRIDFKDQGIGISHEDQASIFEKFTKHAIPIDGSPDGSGIGLAFAKAVIASFNGRIALTSSKNEGSCFTVILPVLPG